jgi:hypothetical protein
MTLVDVKDVINEYSTLQSPAKVLRSEKQQRKELYRECLMIKQEGEAIVAN